MGAEEEAWDALRGRGMLCEALALRAGLRGAVRDIAREAELPALRRAARALGWSLLASAERVLLHPSGTFERVPSCHPGADRRIVYLGPREGCARARRAEAEGRLGELGRVLGYPECCVEHYLGCERGRLVERIRARSKRLDLHAHSLLRGVTGHGFVSHFPCSFSCEETVALGREVRALARERDPGFEAESVRHLSSPLLYLGDGREVLLLGGSASPSGAVGFSRALRPAALGLPDFDEVRLEKEGAVFLRGGRAVGVVGRGAGPCILLSFEG